MAMTESVCDLFFFVRKLLDYKFLNPNVFRYIRIKELSTPA